MTARSVVDVTRAELTSVNQLRREVVNATSRLDLIKSVAGETPSKDFAALIHEHEQKLSDLRERLNAQKRWLSDVLSATFADDSLRLSVAKLHFVDGLNFSAVGRTIFYSRPYVNKLVRDIENAVAPQ